MSKCNECAICTGSTLKWIFGFFGLLLETRIVITHLIKYIDTQHNKNYQYYNYPLYLQRVEWKFLLIYFENSSTSTLKANVLVN